MNKRNLTKNKCLKMTAAFLFPFALFGGGMALSQNKTLAESENVEYIYSYNESVPLTNSDFKQGGTTYLKGNSLSGWNAIEKTSESPATGMLIDVESGDVTNENDETTTFGKNKDNYFLSSNPGSNGNDTRILMINSKEKLSQKNINTSKGYRSSSITLEKNSYYRLSVSAVTMLNGDDNVRASIYLSGVVDKNGEEIELGYEDITTSTWKEYFFFIATGDQAQTVTLDLYLGTKSNGTSSGAVFFDSASVMRYSENAFFDLCKDFDNAEFEDAYEDFYQETVFLINKLQTEKNLVANTDNINLDFENEIPTNGFSLGEFWSVNPSDKANANASIVNIREMQPNDFKTKTGYGYVGNDLSKDNNQALVLWTNSGEYSSSYVGVKSSDIAINAHEVYKVSFKMKSAGIESGSFYVKVSETDAIYDLYPTLLSNEEENDNYYKLGNQSSSGITANVDNAWTNDYQTVEFYVKGHSVYNSFINIEFWLGKLDENAKGCVVIDNVQVEYADYSDFSNASNKLELNAIDEENNDNFTNAQFNNAEMSADNKYPLTATGWTVNKGDEDNNESGVIYISNKAEYDQLYSGYKWYGIKPANNTEDDQANNIYMMYNNKDSYQSITSSSYNLSKANSYYLLNFDYYNQDFTGLTPSAIKVEVIDENGIVLFSKDGISNANKNGWSKMNLYFHLPTNVSHKVQIKVSLGEENNQVGGLVYLDNFNVSVSDETAYTNNEGYKTDLTNYYLNLGEIGREPSINPAYKLEVEEVYNDNYTAEDCGNIGGIVNGKDNEYGITSDKNLLVISNKIASKSTYKSVYKLEMNSSESNYYVLSLNLATIFDIDAENAKTDKHDCKYGFSVKIDGYDAIDGLLTSSELKEYKIYYKTSSSSTPVVSFTLLSDCNETIGSALFNFDFASTTLQAYNEAKNKSNEFIAKLSTAKEENKTPEEEETPKAEKEESGLDSMLLLASSLIMGLALVVAIVGFILRKIKIKKINKVRQESYDRKLSVDHDVILKEAQTRRDNEVKQLQKAKSVLEQDKLEMEEQHKVYVRQAREASNGKLSREVERTFKKYNSDIASMNEKINIVKEKIDYVMTAEYLLSIERKILMEEEERLAREKRERKAALKARLDQEADE